MNTLSRTEIEQVIRELLHKYHAEYALLFGSYARGDYDAESDVDILVLADVPREKLAAYKKPFLKSTSDLGLEYDVVVTVTLKDTDTFEKYLDAVPFYQNVRKEGVPLAV